MNYRLISLLFLCSCILSQAITPGISPCPPGFTLGSVTSSRITIASQRGIIPLNKENDVQCYDFSLPYEFSNVPNVALALHDFQAKQTDNLFFSVKPRKSKSRSYIPLLVRTQWRYTEWVKISFSLLAEDRTDFEAGYYQMDTGELGSCAEGKTAQLSMPFKEIKNSEYLYHNVFLHGFEISTQPYRSQLHSPFEIQILHSSANSQQILLLFSITTITQIHSVSVSYVIWEQTSLSIVNGFFNFQTTSHPELSHTPERNVGRNYARIFGITGFIILHKEQQITFNTEWTGSKFVFVLDANRPLIKYLSYHYIFFLGSLCSDCPRYPYIHLGRCYTYCPEGTYASVDNTCVDCGDGYYWDGTICRKICPKGQFLNESNNECQCPLGSVWNGFSCIVCQGGRVYNKEKGICACPEGTRFNGAVCATQIKCKNGQQWNPFTYMCDCPSTHSRKGLICVKRTICNNGQIPDGKGGCKCQEGTHWNGKWCEADGCIGGQVWNGTACQCENNYHFTGSLCIICINGQQWNSRFNRCDCPINYKWNGNWCQRDPDCSGGRYWNTTFNQCLCSVGTFWNGFQCMVKPDCCCGKAWNTKKLACQCLSSFHWDEHNCVLCINGQTWNQTEKKCMCREGTKWNGQFCVVIQSCYGGMMWNQNTWSCECPAITVWSGSYCIANPCIGGKIWDNIRRQCFCPESWVFVNDYCVPPERACSNGRIWDHKQYKCVCPVGFWENGYICVEIPKCPDGRSINPLNGNCYYDCPYGQVWIESLGGCGDPSCPQNKRWDGFGCVDIACPPNSYFNGTQCISDPSDLCRPWEFWDGQHCVFYKQICPDFTQWNGTLCIPNISNCPVGFYGDGNQCIQFPQLCPPPSKWTGDRCFAGSNCPHSTYFKEGSCYPYMPCQSGQSWDTDMITCLCPEGTEWNGNVCISCSGGKQWVPFVGCQCPTGSFEVGFRCEKISQDKCSVALNAFWDGLQCLCHEGFQWFGLQCICNGVVIRNRCDRCAHRPNSEWKYGRCRCKEGYTNYEGQCLENQIGNDRPDQCNVGTFFDSQQKRCLPCPEGCLSCESSYVCLVCNLDFDYDPNSKLCKEHCGDGRRYVLQCDDDNTINGDGCAEDCRVELGYSCIGGSPNSPDNCIIYKPAQVTMIRTGEVRYPTKIIINVKLDYLPKLLLQSPDCNDRCSGVLDAEVTEGERPISVRSNYMPGTSYSFSVELEFGTPYIGRFILKVKIDPVIGAKYYGGVDISSGLEVEVNPVLLATLDEDLAV